MRRTWKDSLVVIVLLVLPGVLCGGLLYKAISERADLGAVQAAGLPDQRTVIVEAKLRPTIFRATTTLSSVHHPLVPDGVTEGRYQVLNQNVLWRDDYTSGTLSRRVDADTGVCLLPAITAVDGQSITHNITAADTVSVWWRGGERHSMTVTVSGNAVSVDGGSGDDLPGLGTAVDVGADPTATVGNLIYAGDVEKYPADLARIRFIEAAATATLNENYWKP